MVLSTSNHWTLQTSSTIEDPIYDRPLGATELGFYWDSVFERTADTLQHAEIQVDAGQFELINPSNITRAWTEVKRRFPLLGARIEERGEDSIFFTVAAQDLEHRRPKEITFLDISSREEAFDLTDKIIVKDRLLSNECLARIFVLRRTDQPDLVHIVIHVAHCITDGMANIIILKTFLNRICQGCTQDAWDLRERLALSIASEDLIPQRKLSAPRRRWRMAIASVIAAKRASKLTGGHTLPRTITEKTPYTPAHSKVICHSFSLEKSRLVVFNCRKHRMTFGNAYPVLGQIALTRVLLRRYLRGEISEDEWEFRKREPMSSAGPLNLRPFLDKDWIEAGGLTNVCLAISFFFYSLPFMPLGSASKLSPGMCLPSFESLLSRKRFLLRCHSVKNQATNYIRHPLFIELASLSLPRRIERVKTIGLQWRNERGPPKYMTDDPISPMEQACAGLVMCNGGSSMGNIDILLPREYPSDNQHSFRVPLLHLKASKTTLRCRPTELYLGAATSREQLYLSVYWDNNVFDEDTVAEWLEEVGKAIDFYLGEEENIQSRL